MAEVKKATEKKPEVKAEAVAKAAPVETPKVASKAVAPKKAAPKKAAEPKKAEAKKAPAKKAAATKKTTTAKETVKAAVNFEFDGKSYTPEALVKIAKDVFTYDLGGKPSEFKTVDLYVKPEESMVYYVINGELTGNFLI